MNPWERQRDLIRFKLEGVRKDLAALELLKADTELGALHSPERAHIWKELVGRSERLIAHVKGLEERYEAELKEIERRGRCL